jgi:NAD(P)H dehydrogenase (quinone)
MANQGETKAVIGSSAYGAGTVAGGDGSLQPDTRDLDVAKGQGAHFARTVKAYVKGKDA